MGGGGGGWLSENNSFFFILLVAYHSAFHLACSPFVHHPLKHQDRMRGMKYRRKKNGCYQCFEMTRLKKKWCSSTFPLNLSFNIFVS